MCFEDEYDFPLLPHLTVYEEEDEGEFIGLLDQYGNPIYRYNQRNPIGFIHYE